jgi:UDP-glucose 4-epimerase
MTSAPDKLAALPLRLVVTGGAGYIGSHFAHAAVRRGCEVTVIDDLRRGTASDVPAGAALHQVAVEDTEKVHTILVAQKPHAVVHFAGRIDVAESTRKPLAYFADNTQSTAALLAAVLRAAVPHFVFSSTAAVYGEPAAPMAQLAECDLTLPTSAYGESKLAVERMLAHVSKAHALTYTCLRYFNAAGAMPEWGLCERHTPETHLIPLAIDSAVGGGAELRVYGTDYATPDGTAIRDYVHVYDLAHAHLLAIDALRAGAVSNVFNVGSGLGHSVREVLACVGSVTGNAVRSVDAARRPADPAALVANVARIEKMLGFRCVRSDLATIVRDAYASRK